MSPSEDFLKAKLSPKLRFEGSWYSVRIDGILKILSMTSSQSLVQAGTITDTASSSNTDLAWPKERGRKETLNPPASAS